MPAEHELSYRYRGWRVVAGCFLMAMFGWGLGFYGHSVYLAELTRLTNARPVDRPAGWSLATRLVWRSLDLENCLVLLRQPNGEFTAEYGFGPGLARADLGGDPFHEIPGELITSQGQVGDLVHAGRRGRGGDGRGGEDQRERGERGCAVRHGALANRPVPHCQAACPPPAHPLSARQLPTPRYHARTPDGRPIRLRHEGHD